MSSNAFFQNSYYIGNNFNWILYGVNLVLYGQTMYIYSKSRSMRRKSTRFFMCFSTAMLFLITIYVAVQSAFGQEMWIVHADFPGGSAAYLGTYANVWYQTMGTASSVILQLMCDGLLIYRCMVVWRDRRIIILPCILWLATLTFGILDMYASGAPSTNFFVGFAVHINVTYVSISVGLNVLVTTLICGRILYYARGLRRQFGPAISETYFSSAALIVESALPFALFGIAFIVSDAIDSSISIFFLSLYAMFTCVSPQMLILRVASGKGWNSEIASRTGLASVVQHTHPAATTDISTLHLDDHDLAKVSSKDEESGLKDMME